MGVGGVGGGEEWAGGLARGRFLGSGLQGTSTGLGPDRLPLGHQRPSVRAHLIGSGKIRS